MKTLNEDLKTLGLDIKGNLKPDGGVPPKESHPAQRCLSETVIDDARRIIRRNIEDIKNGLQALSLKKEEAQRALSLLRDALDSITLADVAVVSEEEIAEARGVSGPKCDLCDSPATHNFQKLWVDWRIDRNGNYSKTFAVLDDQNPTDEDNLYRCEKHAAEGLLS